MFIDLTSKVSEKQLEYQLHEWHEQIHVFSNVYTSCYVLIMLAYITLFKFTNNDAFNLLLAVVWIGGWMLMGGDKKTYYF